MTPVVERSASERHPLPAASQRCIEAALACFNACQKNADVSLVASDPEEVEATRLCLDCAAVSATCAVLVARSSDLSVAAAALCAAASERCVEEFACLKDPRWVECAKACQEAATRCRDLFPSEYHGEP
jgi:hypothetical protein